MPPARYRNARSQHVCFRADVSAPDPVLPACFEASEDGFCVATGLSIPWSANYESFDESFPTVKCAYEGRPGYFTPIAFLNSRSSIPAGREIYGTPKVFAEIEVDMDERVMYTDTRLTGISILSIRSTMHREASTSDLPQMEPPCRLKAIPRADGRGPDLMQLIDCSRVTTDVATHVCRAGDGVAQFNRSPIYDLSDFVPLEYYGAAYAELDYTDGYAEVVHDFMHQT